MKHILTALLLPLATLISITDASERQALIQSLDVHVPVAPTPVVVDGRYRLVYELHVRNFQRADIDLRHIEITDGSGEVLAQFKDAALDAIVERPGAHDKTSKSKLDPGTHAVFFLWLTLEPGVTPPRTLEHTITFELLRASDRLRGTLENFQVAVASDSPVVLDPPLRGGPWAAIYDPHMRRGHRTSIYTLDGRARIPARFAIDWIRLGEDGSKAGGDASQIENWHGYSEEVFAVADATVVAARDDMIDPTAVSAAQGSMALENASGNYVVLDIGSGRYAFYEHLKHGSIKVRSGEAVTSGQVIGRLGNSGSSSAGPHLHFHVADTSALLGAEGLPYVFNTFNTVGTFESIAAFRRDERWRSSTLDGVRVNELPEANSVVVFEGD